MMGTFAMYHKDMSMKYYHNSMLKVFSADLRTTFKHLDIIHDKTASTRIKLITREVIAHHSSDNYQEYHQFNV